MPASQQRCSQVLKEACFRPIACLVKDAALKAGLAQRLPVQPGDGGNADVRQRQAVVGLHAHALVSSQATHVMAGCREAPSGVLEGCLTRITRAKSATPARLTLWPMRCQRDSRCGCVALPGAGGPSSMTPLCACGTCKGLLWALGPSCTPSPAIRHCQRTAWPGWHACQCRRGTSGYVRIKIC